MQSVCPIECVKLYLHFAVIFPRPMGIPPLFWTFLVCCLTCLEALSSNMMVGNGMTTVNTFVIASREGFALLTEQVFLVKYRGVFGLI